MQGQGGLPGRRFVFVVERAEDPQRSAEPQVPPRLLLGAYAQPSQPLPDWRAGDHWQLPVRLRRPHGLSNPHAFDYELWLFEQGLRATGVLRPGAVGCWRPAAPGASTVGASACAMRSSAMSRTPGRRRAGGAEPGRAGGDLVGCN